MHLMIAQTVYEYYIPMEFIIWIRIQNEILRLCLNLYWPHQNQIMTKV